MSKQSPNLGPKGRTIHDCDGYGITSSKVGEKRALNVSVLDDDSTIKDDLPVKDIALESVSLSIVKELKKISFQLSVITGISLEDEDLEE